MESSAKPDNYIFIPAEVKNCKELKPNEKIIFGDITCLCNQKGYCWAGNHYFAELYGVSKRSVSRYINRLKELNFITIEMIRDANKNVIKRTIKINDNPIEKTDYTSGQNCLAPIDRTVQYNNTSNNNNHYTYCKHTQIHNNNNKHKINEAMINNNNMNTNTNTTMNTNK